jgi:hypothetical protein
MRVESDLRADQRDVAKVFFQAYSKSNAVEFQQGEPTLPDVIQTAGWLPLKMCCSFLHTFGISGDRVLEIRECG